MRKLVTSPWGPNASNDNKGILLTGNGKFPTIEERNPIRLFWSYNDGPAHDPELRIVVKAPGGDFWFYQDHPKKLNVTDRYRLYTDPSIFRYLSSADSREIKASFYNRPFHSRNISFWIFGKEIRKEVSNVTSSDDMILVATVQGSAISGTSDMQVRVNGENCGIWPRS